nr:class I SAM-dependent methyltransferase [Longirhabdus pacifica]
MNTRYNKIGNTYNVTRKADDRLTHKILSHLNINVPAHILDVGAGSGNYSFELANMGYRVTAVEPSQVMMEQSKRHKNLTWNQGAAENLPLDTWMESFVPMQYIILVLWIKVLVR